jgi:NADPH2 dehydrogenase
MRANYANQDNNVSQCLIDYHVAIAKGGLRFITIEATAVDPLGKSAVNQLGLWSDDHLDGLKKIVDECHKYSVKVSVQLHCAGSETGAPEEMDEIIQKLADAARRCRDAGVDTTYPVIVRTEDLSIIEIGALARRLEDAGINAILVSARSGYITHIAERIKKSVKIPVIIKILLLPLSNTLKLMSQRIFCRLARRI